MTPSPTPYSFEFTVNREQLSVYAAPGENYAVLGTVRRGDRLLVVGRVDDGTWWQVDFFGLEGWIPAQPVGLEVHLADLPIVPTPVGVSTVTPTSIPATPTPTPTPPCSVEPRGEFEAMWREELTRTRLGCPLEQAHITGSAHARFQHGFMHWREGRQLIYVLYDAGHWQEFGDLWEDGNPQSAGLSPPPGLLEPIRGFGLVWREHLGGPEADIGWATEHEKGGETTVEDFEHGVILKIETRIYLLYRDTMTWQLYAPGIGVPVATPHQGTRIVFVSDRNGNDEIYIMNRDGSAHHKLTDHPAEDDLPAVSPDGRWIAFQSRRDENWEIYVMNLDGSGLRRVTNDPATDRLPTWSPDSQWIIFSSDRDGDYDFYAIRPDGAGLRQLTNDEWFDGRASWSKNGLIAFNSGQIDSTTWEITTIRADGSDRRQLTHNDVNDWSPNWSPDGQTILFISRRDGDPAIYLMDADGGNPRLLYNSPGYEWSAVFAPDGRTIAFTSDQSGENEIYTLNVENALQGTDGGDAIRLTNQRGCWYPSWAP
jgi:Tol biopolymer transport system component/uncharacterized protein YraI